MRRTSASEWEAFAWPALDAGGWRLRGKSGGLDDLIEHIKRKLLLLGWKLPNFFHPLFKLRKATSFGSPLNS